MTPFVGQSLNVYVKLLLTSKEQKLVYRYSIDIFTRKKLTHKFSFDLREKKNSTCEEKIATHEKNFVTITENFQHTKKKNLIHEGTDPRKHANMRPTRFKRLMTNDKVIQEFLKTMQKLSRFLTF